MSELVLLRDEELKMQLRPHVFSFFYLYVIFFLLLVWAYIIYDFFAQDKFTTFPLYEVIIKIPFANEVLAGAMIWSLGLLIVGFLARFFFLDSGGQNIFRLYTPAISASRVVARLGNCQIQISYSE